MANLRENSALDALNEDKYINTMYDQTKQTQDQMLQNHYAQNIGSLDTAQQNTQQQTQEHLNRTQVEADRSAAGYNGNRLSAGANQQAVLSQGVTRQQNVTTLQNQQSQADAEVERQRQLLAQQYTALIKQAQADNDMGRAQALYDAAKAEEQQLLAYRQQAAGLLAGKGDTSVYEQLLTGGIPAQQTTGDSWEEVLRNEGALNQIYDAMQESANQELLMDYQKASSDLEAQRQAQQRKTDTELNSAYVNALRKGKNYAEVQNAYGQGSGTAAQAQVARDSELLKTLTGLRGLQTNAEAQEGLSAYEQGKAYRDAEAKSKADIDAKRLAALIGAAEEEERILAENQALAGNYFAKNQNDYSILGKLLGLTQDQIDRLQGTGAYARTYAPLPAAKPDNLTGLSANNAMYGTSPYLYLANGEKAYLY